MKASDLVTFAHNILFYSKDEDTYVTHNSWQHMERHTKKHISTTPGYSPGRPANNYAHFVGS